ncbi:MAG: PAS domain S-box protein [Vicinamibacteria bacterium]|nr:PAS domain S-box protein [Vicinamibacteria bacterium]
MKTHTAAELRRRAMERLAERRRTAAVPPPGPDLERLVEELRVHQVELELQNEELVDAREALEGLVARYTDLYDFAPVGYVTVDPAGVIQEANLAAAALLAVDRSRLAGRRFDEFFAAAERPTVVRCIVQARDDAAKAVCDASLHASLGRLHVRVEAVAALDGQSCRVALVDFTARRRAEAELEASEARFRLLFESSRDGVALIDAATGRVIAVNPAFWRALGGAAADYVAKGLWEIAPLRSLAASHRAFVELLGRGLLHFEHLRLERLDGRGLDVELSVHTYRVGAGHVTQLALHDIGERLRGERFLREAQDQLADARRMEAVGRLAGGLAHELNSHLGVILGCAELLQRGAEPGAKDGRRHEQIEAAARQCADLTRQLVAFAGKQVLRPQRVTPSTLVAAALPLLNRLLGPDTRLETRLEAAGEILVDPAQLETILVALVARACNPARGARTVRIETADETLEAPQSGRALAAPGPWVTVRISDDGLALDAASRALLFEPFFETGPTGGGHGAGLRLAAVHGTVEQSGGALVVESGAERGTTLKLSFPRVVDAPALPVARLGLALRDGGTIRASDAGDASGEAGGQEASDGQ